MKLHHLALATMLLASPILATAATTAAPATAAKTDSAHADAGIAWFKGDVDAAFALAKSSKKPLFLFWGASWCPPCNQVKSTIFNRQGFIERSRYFVPVYVDGDAPSAQKLGARFKVRGYPTMILFKPDGGEVTRLPGEVDAARYLQVLTMGMSANHTVQELLNMANSEPSKLSGDDWRLLSFYTWDASEQHLVSEKEMPATLMRLAKASTDADSATRLQIRAWMSMQEGKQVVSEQERAAIVKRLQDERWTRDNMDLVTNGAANLLAILNQGLTDKAPLTKIMQQTLNRLLADQSLSKADRLGALAGLVAIAKPAKDEKFPEEFIKLVREQVASIEKSTTDAFERQAVVSAAGYVLGQAGLLAESDQLLTAELKRSHSPYYFMLSLANNAKKRGDSAAALSWYEQAYKASKGPATRLQWGAAYIAGLIDLTPQDEARISSVVDGVLQELANTPDALYDRNRNVLERTGRKLVAWNLDGKHQKVYAELQAKIDGLCAKLPKNEAERAVCKGILQAPKEQL